MGTLNEDEEEERLRVLVRYYVCCGVVMRVFQLWRYQVS